MNDLMLGLLQIVTGFAVLVVLAYFIGWNNGYDECIADIDKEKPVSDTREPLPAAQKE